MAAELAVQTKIVQSVRKDRGYARKMSNRFAIGVPDLIVALYPFAPVFIEVKDFGPVNDKFRRQIAVTPKQRHEMQLFSSVYDNGQHPYTPDRNSAFVAVALVHRGEHRLVLLPWCTEVLDAGYEDDPSRWRKRQTGGYYEMAPLLEGGWSNQGEAMMDEFGHVKGSPGKSPPSAQAVIESRESSHGDYRQQAGTSQEIKRALHRHPKWADMTDPQRESLEMIAVKMSRILNGDPNVADHWTDMAGYATLISNIITKGHHL